MEQSYVLACASGFKVERNNTGKWNDEFPANVIKLVCHFTYTGIPRNNTILRIWRTCVDLSGGWIRTLRCRGKIRPRRVEKFWWKTMRKKNSLEQGAVGRNRTTAIEANARAPFCFSEHVDHLHANLLPVFSWISRSNYFSKIQQNDPFISRNVIPLFLFYTFSSWPVSLLHFYYSLSTRDIVSFSVSTIVRYKSDVQSDARIISACFATLPSRYL